MTFLFFCRTGQHFLFTIHSLKKGYGGIYAGSIDAPDARVRLLEDASNAEYTSTSDTGYVLFPRHGVLMAQRFAADALKFIGKAFPIVDAIPQNPGNLSASFSASQNVLVVTETYLGDQVTWFDRTGNRLETIGRPGLHIYPQLSPDEQTLLMDEIDPERFAADIWLFPVRQGAAGSRFTLQGSCRGVWSPDSARIAFETLDSALYVKSSAGAENEARLLEVVSPMDHDRIPCEWSKDGRFLVYSERDAKTEFDLWALPLFGNRKPFAFLHTEHNEWCGTLSPDTKWIAYASDESGKNEIYVQTFPAEAGKSYRRWQVSNDGGSWPKWRRDGKELLYLSSDKKIVAVPVTAGTSFERGTPQPLFASGIRTPDARFDVTTDGRRIVIPTITQATKPMPATVTINWTAGINP